MGGLASFAMRGRSQAAMAATGLAMLALVVPLLSILSSAVVALVTMRKGLGDGLMVGAISSLASGLLAHLLLGSPLPVVGFMLVLWLPAWALGAVLRTTRSLGLVVQLALGFSLMLIGAWSRTSTGCCGTSAAATGVTAFASAAGFSTGAAGSSVAACTGAASAAACSSASLSASAVAAARRSASARSSAAR